jgi:hypothetical protein
MGKVMKMEMLSRNQFRPQADAIARDLEVGGPNIEKLAIA